MVRANAANAAEAPATSGNQPTPPTDDLEFARQPPRADQHHEQRDHEVPRAHREPDRCAGEREPSPRRRVDRAQTREEGQQTEAGRGGVAADQAPVVEHERQHRPGTCRDETDEGRHDPPADEVHQGDGEQRARDRPQPADHVEARRVFHVAARHRRRGARDRRAVEHDLPRPVHQGERRDHRRRRVAEPVRVETPVGGHVDRREHEERFVGFGRRKVASESREEEHRGEHDERRQRADGGATSRRRAQPMNARH